MLIPAPPHNNQVDSTRRALAEAFAAGPVTSAHLSADGIALDSDSAWKPAADEAAAELQRKAHELRERESRIRRWAETVQKQTSQNDETSSRLYAELDKLRWVSESLSCRPCRPYDHLI